MEKKWIKYGSIPVFMMMLLISHCKNNAEKFKTELDVVKQYAESYSPEVKDGKMTSLLIEKPPKNVEEAIAKLAKEKVKEHEKYMFLIFLKLYDAHLTYTHQAHDLRPDEEIPYKIPANALVREFCRLQNVYVTYSESIPSSMAYDNLEDKKSLMDDYQPLTDEYNKVQQDLKNPENKINKHF